MKTATRKPFVSSGPLGQRRSTSSAALDARFNRALDAIPALRGANACYRAGERNSEIVATLDNGASLLVSYETVVAFRLPDSASVACVTLGHHSRTTDKSIRGFATGGELVELTPAAFLEAVADAATL